MQVVLSGRPSSFSDINGDKAYWLLDVDVDRILPRARVAAAAAEDAVDPARAQPVRALAERVPRQGLADAQTPRRSLLHQPDGERRPAGGERFGIFRLRARADVEVLRGQYDGDAAGQAVRPQPLRRHAHPPAHADAVPLHPAGRRCAPRRRGHRPARPPPRGAGGLVPGARGAARDSRARLAPRAWRGGCWFKPAGTTCPDALPDPKAGYLRAMGRECDGTSCSRDAKHETGAVSKLHTFYSPREAAMVTEFSARTSHVRLPRVARCAGHRAVASMVGYTVRQT